MGAQEPKGVLSWTIRRRFDLILIVVAAARVSCSAGRPAGCWRLSAAFQKGYRLFLTK